MNTDYKVPIEDMVGAVIYKIVGKAGDEELRFHAADERTFIFYHGTSCCESVTVEDIAGDLDDLLNSPLVMAEVVSSDRPDLKDSDVQEWHFYKFATVKGSVTVRWYGSSNGCYSTEVDLRVER